MKRRLLVIDDELSLLFAVRDYFETLGFDVECAGELQEAQALLANFHFDVIVTDLHLSDLHSNEGLSVIEFLHERNLQPAVIVLTAYATTEVEAEAMRVGAGCVLRKPIALHALAATIDSLAGVSI